MKCLILSLAFILASIRGSDGHGVSQLSALRKALLDGYDKDVKPDEAVESKLSVHINDLSLCPKKQVKYGCSSHKNACMNIGTFFV